MTTPSEAVRVAVQWQAHPSDLYVWWLVDATGALVAEVGSVLLTGYGAYYAYVKKERLPLDYADQKSAQLAAEAALAALSLHVGDAADVQSDVLGASASPTACSGPSAPEPQSVSALRVPPAGAGGQSEAVVRDAMRYRWLCDNNFDRPGVTQVHTWLQTWEPHSQTGEPTEWTQRIRGGRLDAVIDAALATDAQAIVTREGQDPQGLGGEAIERGPAGMRPEEIAQPSLHIEPVAEVFQSGPGAYQIRFLTELPVGTKLYTSPTTPTEGPALLTDEEIDAALSAAYSEAVARGITNGGMAGHLWDHIAARAIESKVRAGTLTDPEGAS